MTKRKQVSFCIRNIKTENKDELCIKEKKIRIKEYEKFDIKKMKIRANQRRILYKKNEKGHKKIRETARTSQAHTL